MATLDTVTDFVHHEEELHTQLPLTQKLKIITYFDEVKAKSRNSLASSGKRSYTLDNIDQVEENVEVHSLSKVDKIVQEALRGVSNRFTSKL